MAVRPRMLATPFGRAPSKSKSVLASSPAIPSTVAFYLDDFGRTLFPLQTNRELIRSGEHHVKEYVKKCLDPAELAYAFLAQRRVYAAKPGGYLRRTVKLDPIAEYYIYDLIFQNRSLFRKPHSPGRNHYGYRFEHGAPIASTAAYKGFKGALSEYSNRYKYSMGFDIAAYFNGVYHHDLGRVDGFNKHNAASKTGESREGCYGFVAA